MASWNFTHWSFFFLTICPAALLLTICFIPNFATIDGHDRGFNNLLCGKPTLKSQEDVNLSDCSMEVRVVKVFLPLAAIFQLFAVIQGMSIKKWHSIKDNNIPFNASDNLFFFSTDGFTFLSIIFFLTAGLTYSTNMDDMKYMINHGNPHHHDSFLKDGLFGPLFVATICLQGCVFAFHFATMIIKKSEAFFGDLVAKYSRVTQKPLAPV